MMEDRWGILVFVLVVAFGPILWRSWKNRVEYLSQIRQFREHYRLPKSMGNRDVMGFCKVVSRLNLEDREHLDQLLNERLTMKQSKEDVWKAFHDAGMGDLWYANPGGEYPRINFGGRWFAGVWTGPQHDLICVKKCDTNEEAEEWLSPEGRTPEEAAQLSLEKRKQLAKGQQVCHRCGFVGPAWSEKLWHFCGKCHEDMSKNSCFGKASGKGDHA